MFPMVQNGLPIRHWNILGLSCAIDIMPNLIPVLDKNIIAEKVEKIAQQISIDYKDSELVLVGVLKGAFVFMADLLRQIQVSRLTIDFVRVTSYGQTAETSGNITLLKDLETDIKGKDVLIVEDILDSGLTLSYLKQHLQTFNPKTVKICVLIDKYERRQADVRAEYVCHAIKEGFLVGYGLDYAEAYRNLPGIFTLNF